MTVRPKALQGRRRSSVASQQQVAGLQIAHVDLRHLILPGGTNIVVRVGNGAGVGGEASRTVPLRGARLPEAAGLPRFGAGGSQACGADGGEAEADDGTGVVAL